MFEGKPPRMADSGASEAAPGDDVLRALSWHDLVARLAAARDVRSSSVSSQSHGDGSFDAGSARRIAAHHHGKQSVNLEDLSDGKGPAGMPVQAQRGATGVARK
jgi:hypothetical protein